MKDSFRQSMAWLHTWCGLTAGWLLCAIFLTGTLSVFRDPITRWMQAKPALVVPAGAMATSLDDAVLQRAVAHLREKAPAAAFWRLELPERAGDALELFWGPAKVPQRVVMDPASGELLPMPWGRQTEGGRHFMTFHYTLHGGIPGFWLVGWVAMCMLVALVSGVVVHKRIFKDFFTFRPGKGQRSWLDAHNATAVLTLPFLFMIGYTGLAFFYSSYMPLPLRATFGWDDKAYGRFQAELAPQAGVRRTRTGQPAELRPLAPLLQEAQALTGDPARMLMVERPGDASMVVRVFARKPDTGSSRRLLNTPASVAFDGVSGAVLELKTHDPHGPPAMLDAHHAIETLHVAGFGGWTLKWLYFISGLAGTAMVATGTLLFSVKRRKKSEHEFGAATSGIYRCIEALNVAALAGVALACIAYLYGNRLVPAELPGRAQWEIRLFMLVWLASLVHALLRPPRHAWAGQLALAGLLCLGLPLLNGLTTGQHLLRYANAADWPNALLELTVIGFGLALVHAARKVRRAAWQTSAPRTRRHTADAAAQGATP